MDDATNDAQLVTSYLAGDRSALAGLYDRFADAIYDTAAAMLGDRHEAADVVQDVFVIAAEKLGQLRDPARCKAWLFAVMRNEVYRRSRRRKRSVPTDFTMPGLDMAAPPDTGADGEGVELAELAELVRGAAAGLDERDQLVLELSVRQGLQGADLAAALGVTPGQSYSIVHRMRERAERSLGAYCLARRGRADCPELRAILRGWDGEFSVLVRKRVARHIDVCERCERNRRKLAPLALFGAAPAMAAPADLRQRVLRQVEVAAAPGREYGFDEAGFPTPLRAARRRPWWLAPVAAALVLVLGGAGLWATTGRGDGGALTEAPPAATAESLADASSTAATVAGSVPPPGSATATSAATAPATVTAAPTTTVVVVAPPATRPAPTTTSPPTPTPPATTSPPTTAAPPPGVIQLDTALADLGASATSATVTLSNPGGTAYTWSLSGPESFAVSPAGGTLAPGGTQPITVSFDRTDRLEDTYEAAYAITAPGLTGATLTTRARVEIPPVVRWSPQPPSAWNCNSTLTVRFTVDDSSPISSATVTWSGAATGSVAANPTGTAWTAVITVATPGTWTFTASATDGRGNTGTSVPASTVVLC
jgi:RNA polymerase sigma factor (sigma-70 family)